MRVHGSGECRPSNRWATGFSAMLSRRGNLPSLAQLTRCFVQTVICLSETPVFLRVGLGRPVVDHRLLVRQFLCRAEVSTSYLAPLAEPQLMISTVLTSRNSIGFTIIIRRCRTAILTCFCTILAVSVPKSEVDVINFATGQFVSCF